MHPDVLEVLAAESSLPDGFADVDARSLSWSLALIRAWFDRALLVSAGAERLTVLVLSCIVEAGGTNARFFSLLNTRMAPSYASSALGIIQDCPADIEPLDFVPYWVVLGRDAARIMRAGISLEYAAELSAQT